MFAWIQSMLAWLQWLWETQDEPMEYSHLLSNESEPGIVGFNLEQFLPKRLCFDTMIISSTNTPLQRRLTLDPRINMDIMCADVYHRIDGVELQPYQGGPIAIPEQPDQQPLGTVVIQWYFYGGNKVYETTFHVVREAKFDMLLGNLSIEYKVKEEIQKLEGDLCSPDISQI